MFYRLPPQYFGVFGAGFLEHPSPFPLAGVNVLFGVFGEDGFVVVDLACGFSVFGPVDDPVFEGGGVMVEVVVADGGYGGFVGGFRDDFAQAGYGLELEGAAATRIGRDKARYRHPKALSHRMFPRMCTWSGRRSSRLPTE